jgi:hypothetical protein
VTALCSCGVTAEGLVGALLQVARDAIADHRPEALDQTAIEAAALVSLWTLVRQGDPHALMLLQQLRGPELCRASWSDRVWPVPPEFDLEENLLGWLRTRERLG